MMRPLARSIGARVIAVAMLATGLGACSPWASGDGVSVLAAWTGSERESFEKVLDAFREETGVSVDYQGSRAVNEVLLAQIRKGSPPDLAALWSPGDLAKYAKSGDLRPLGGVLGAARQRDYDRQWLMPQRVDGTEHVFAVPIKANLKSMIWFAPEQLSGPPPGTWNELVDRSRALARGGTAPWCMGMGDTSASGWPGTDWIEDILLYQAGRDIYDRWATGQLAWESKEVRRAWTTWGEITAGKDLVYGGSTAALLTDFQDAGRPMFDRPPGCAMEHQASFVVDGYRSAFQESTGRPLTLGTDIRFFPFPRFGPEGAPEGGAETGTGREPGREPGGEPEPSAAPVRLSADLLVMFRDRPETRRLIRFMASEKAQRIWPSLPGSSAYSLNRRVSPGSQGSGDTGREISAILTAPGTKCFDASDTFPAVMRNAFNRAILEYLNEPDRLSTLLEELDRIRSTIGAQEWAGPACGR